MSNATAMTRISERRVQLGGLCALIANHLEHFQFQETRIFNWVVLLDVEHWRGFRNLMSFLSQSMIGNRSWRRVCRTRFIVRLQVADMTLVM